MQRASQLSTVLQCLSTGFPSMHRETIIDGPGCGSASGFQSTSKDTCHSAACMPPLVLHGRLNIIQVIHAFRLPERLLSALSYWNSIGPARARSCPLCILQGTLSSIPTHKARVRELPNALEGSSLPPADLPNKHLLCTCSSVPVRCVLLKTHWIKNICQISKCKVKVRCQGCLRWVADTDGFLCTQGNTNEQFKIYNLQVLELLHFLGKKKLLLWTRCETGIWC